MRQQAIQEYVTPEHFAGLVAYPTSPDTATVTGHVHQRTPDFGHLRLAVLDQKSIHHLGGVFTGMSTQEFIQALNAGRRSYG